MGLSQNGRVALLRTCGPLGESSHEKAAGFRWPLTVGAEVTAPDWKPDPICGFGLHGLLWGVGNRELLSRAGERVWVVFSACTEDVVEIDGEKAKAYHARVEYVGDEDGAHAALVSLSSIVVLRGEVPIWALSRDGYGNGDGYGYASGDGYGYASGDGYGYGYGYGYGDGNGDGNGDCQSAP